MVSVQTIRIGLISDTHGLVRRAAVEALQGISLILHAGDVGRAEVLAELRLIAPVLAIRGNVDRDGWAADLPQELRTTIAEREFLVVHNARPLRPAQLAADGIDVVVCGHSHQPLAEEHDGVLFVNPGSAGPRRFSLPVTLAVMQVPAPGAGTLSSSTVEFVTLFQDPAA